MIHAIRNWAVEVISPAVLAAKAPAPTGISRAPFWGFWEVYICTPIRGHGDTGTGRASPARQSFDDLFPHQGCQGSWVMEAVPPDAARRVLNEHLSKLLSMMPGTSWMEHLSKLPVLTLFPQVRDFQVALKCHFSLNILEVVFSFLGAHNVSPVHPNCPSSCILGVMCCVPTWVHSSACCHWRWWKSLWKSRKTREPLWKPTTLLTPCTVRDG